MQTIKLPQFDVTLCSYDRALRQMMGGRLDAKSQQPLEEEMVRPSWMDNKPEAEMSEEEIKEVRTFEKKLEAIREEKEKTRKALETELKKLQAQVNLCFSHCFSLSYPV